MKKTDILIVGGGLAGLGCAFELAKQGTENFLLLTQDIGGRAPDAEKTPPRATFYARTEYKNLYPFLKTGRKADVWKGRLVTPEKTWRPLFIFLKHPVASIKFYFLIRKFDRHYEKFARRSETISQKQAFEEDSFLKRLYTQSASDYLKETNLSVLQEELIGTLVRVTRFITIKEASAFLMFWIWLILVKNGRECTIDFNKLVSNFKDKVIKGEIVSIQKAESTWVVTTREGLSIETRTLVVATPINVTKKLLDIKLPEYHITEVYSALVKGKVKEQYDDGRYNVLPSNESDVVVVNNDDGTYLFCSTKENYDLSKYFENFEVIETKNWNPAGFFGRELVEAKQAKNLYVIGDYHFPGLEAAFVTGMQAARSILQD